MARPLQRLQNIAEDQWGLVTRRQAEGAGVGWTSLHRMVETGRLERVDRGIYRIRGAVQPDHLALRAAWLQLDPDRSAWARLEDPEVALVSHASAAALYDIGDLRADVHEFTIPGRRQSRRPDVRIHRGTVDPHDRLVLHGLPATRAGRMVADLLADHVDPTAVAGVIEQVMRHVYDYPAVVAEKIAPYAGRFGLKAGDGIALLDHMLRIAGSDQRELLLAEARRD
jgi:predicted transcriptional regulator of viral defense system